VNPGHEGVDAVNGEQDTIAKILVVDDETGMREGCRRALTPVGYHVDTTASVSAAQSLVRDDSHDLYLLDVMLPDGSGLDLIEPILDRDPNAICIIITGYSSIELAVEAVRRGAYNFLSKPFTSEQLVVAVRQGLERRRLKAVEREAEELARAKEELERLDEAKSRFMLKVAHELRAPVAAVQSYVNLILGGYVPQDEMKTTLGRVEVRLQELLDLIGDLLELARLKEPGKISSVEVKPQDMGGVLQEVCELLGKQAQEKGQHLQVNIEDTATVMANRDHLRQICTNLVSNAIKYTPEGGSVMVTLKLGDECIIGEIADTGIGIAGSEIPHIFDELYRTEGAKASGEIGTGLGLAIVKQLIDIYGGEIRVRSDPGQGSCFTFVLPLEPSFEVPQQHGPGEAEEPSAVQAAATADSPPPQGSEQQT
jgi:two-component system sensor histidine kinase/response regulator